MLYANQLYGLGMREYITDLKRKRAQEGLGMSIEFKEKLEEMLWRPHNLEIKKMQMRLQQSKYDERKVLSKIEELVQKYKTQCLPRKERLKYSKQTPLKVLREDFKVMKL